MKHIKNILKSWYDTFEDTLWVVLFGLFVIPFLNLIVTVFVYYRVFNLPEWLCWVMFTASWVYFPKIVDYVGNLDLDSKIKNWLYKED